MLFDNKSILISGGTGSFGSSMIKFILLNFKPKRLICFSRDELKQFNLSKELNEKKNSCLRFFIGDIRDFDRLNLAMRNVDYVIHAAALKHVPAAEYNPFECIKTNINGTENIVRAAIENKVKKIITLSTDKACNPINLYGASKLAADKITISANNYAGNSKTRLSVVRYGNVLNSRGSVIPFFKECIKNKKPFPITDKDMTRFWINLEEALKFVIFCMKDMNGGELYVPKLKSSFIVDLAKSINHKHKISFTGIRPGEKIDETLISPDESQNVIEFTNYYLITPSIKFYDTVNNYKINSFKEKGKNVKKGFSFTSRNNKDFLKLKEFKKYFQLKVLSNKNF
jgi:UDP-N-acetylglucosamine 4,6-dehydratase